MYTALRTGNLSDDSTLKKRLERHSYLYYALLALQYRTMRLDPHSPVDLDNDALYEQATNVLDAMGLDQLSNVALRQQMQSMLQPQVETVLAAFATVDARLGVPASSHATDAWPRLPDACHDILQTEWDRTSQQLSEATARSTASVDFLRTKQQAMALLATHYHWSFDGASSDDVISPKDGIDAFGMVPSEQDIDTNLSLIRYHQALNLCRSALIRDTLGYSIVALRSQVDTSGRGVYVDGSALAGSIVAFQPGDVWPKEHLLTTSPDVMDHFDETDDDCRVSLRFDDYVIDARRSPVTVLSQDGSMNPWALGHMVNHPNFPAQHPNALSTMLNFTDRMSETVPHLVRYIPNTYAKAPSWQSAFFDAHVMMHGLCLLSRRDVCDEELLYDYRLQTDEPPAWYSVVRYDDGFDEEQVVFFRDEPRQQ